MKNLNNKLTVIVIAAFFVAVTMLCWFIPAKEYSYTERRKLAQSPEIAWTTIKSGKFMTDFESYSQDQFPFREGFRSLKALVVSKIFAQRDNHGIYIVNGSAAKTDFELSDASINNAANKFQLLYKSYIEGKADNVFVSIIPDKGYFLAPMAGYPVMDYKKLVAGLTAKMSYAKYIDIFDTLAIEDYYLSDPHWKQESIADTARVLASGMGVSLEADNQINKLDYPFKGVYAGQSALPFDSETIYYVSNDAIDGCSVFNHESNIAASVYDMEKGMGKDPYELYLSGPISLITIENPKASTDKELVIFRDSFGSSIAPYFIEAYSKITLVDIRYLNSNFVGALVDFEGQDVLFLYSTLVLNHSETMK